MIGTRGLMIVRFCLATVALAAGFVVAIEAALEGANFFSPNTSALELWWLIMVALGVLVFALSVGSPWLWTGCLAASLLIGVSAQLGLTQPDWFQKVQISINSNFVLVLYVAVGIQAVIALMTLVATRALAGVPRLLAAMGPARAILFVLIMMFFSATAMDFIGKQAYVPLLKQFAITSTFLAVNAATIFAIAASLPLQNLSIVATNLERLISFPGAVERVRQFDRYLPWLTALGFLVVCCLLCIFAFERLPHVEDEVVYLFQAKYFLNGQISLPAPSADLAKGLDYYLLNIIGDKWFATTAPGWPLVLALGVAASLGWLVNPLLGVLSLLLAHKVLLEISNRGTANAVVLLLAISPWFLATSASLMTHTLTLALMLGAWLLLLKARDNSSATLAFFAGNLMGYMFLARALDAVIIGGLTGLWTLFLLVDHRHWKIVLGYGFGCIAVGALLFPYNMYFTGDPLVTPLNHYIDNLWYSGANSYGFGANIGPGAFWGGSVDLYPGHSPLESLIHFQHNGYTTNFELFGWGIGSLSFVLVHMFWGRWTRTETYMAVILGVTIIALSLYWFSGSFYIGPRYWFMMLFPLAVLTVSGIGTLSLCLQADGRIAMVAERLGFIVVVLCAVAVVSFLTWRGMAKYHELRNFHSDYRVLLQENDLEDGLVFLNADSDSEVGSAFVFNSPMLSGREPIFVRDLGPQSNRAIADLFPDRDIYYADGRSDGGAKAQFRSGSPSSALQE